MSIWYLFLLIIGILVSIGFGLMLSSKIQNVTIYLLFWFMYIVTLLTVVTIIISIVFYSILSKKKGPRGKKGERGDQGELGETGLCDINCRSKICTNKIMDMIRDEVNNLAGNPDPDIKIKNLYIRERAKQICNSDEFKEFAPHRGANDLIAHLKNIWKEWIGLIYRAGGSRYFESIGAENEWEWVKDNPFDEIKKYDIFYWGLGKEYRPHINRKCTPADDFEATPNNRQKGFPEKDKDTQFEGKGWKKSAKKSTKYSILSYLNLVPEGYIVHRESGKKLLFKTISKNSPNEYLIKNFNPSSEKYDACLTVKGDGIEDKNCNPNNKKQIWMLEFTGNTQSELRIKSINANKYLEMKPLSQSSESTISKLVTALSTSSRDYTLFDLQANIS